MNYYHPTTLEHIRNPLPAVKEWAKSTTLAVPDYDPATQQCRFLDGAWAVETSISTPTKAEKLKVATAIYKEDVESLQSQYLTALFENNTDNVTSIKAEATTRKAAYLAELADIRRVL